MFVFCLLCGIISHPFDKAGWLIEPRPEYGKGVMLILCPECKKTAEINKEIRARAEAKLLGIAN